MVNNSADWFLNYILEIAEGDKPIVFSITLTVGGLLVSGMPIGTKAYFDRVTELLGEAQDRTAGNGDIIRRPFSQLAETVEAGRQKQDVEFEQLTSALAEGEQLDPEQAQKFERQYVNLGDVRTLGPNGKLIRTPVWRGRVSEVAGWNFGTLEES